MLNLEPHSQGIVLCVRAQPGARRNAIGGEHGGALKVAVTQIAEKGKANRAILALLCAALRLRASQIELLSGETSREKRFLIREISAAELTARLENTAN